jgi:hypothetical protein
VSTLSVCVYTECVCLYLLCVSVSPSTIAALWYLEVGGASGCLTALQGGGGGRDRDALKGTEREGEKRGRMSACRK